jgi:formylglycine-generating enzyme required for sulfatase activity/serine/threonine protein kinase
MDSTGSSAPAPGAFSPSALKAGDRIAETYVLRNPLNTSESELFGWIAEDELSGAEVSLHFVPAEVSGDIKLRESLRAEVRRGRQMIHPNILRVHDILEEGDCVAIVADSYEGESVAQRCAVRAGGALNTSELEPLVRPVVRTLADAHSARLIHRNISAASIIVTREGHVLLTGFGTMRLIADALQRVGSQSPMATRLLASTSPNILRNGKPEVADDLYSLGATLFEITVGRPLFQGPDLGRQVLTEKPLSIADGRVLAKLQPVRLFKNWEKVIAACLAKDPSARPPSMTELGVQLGLSEDRLEEEPIDTPVDKAKAEAPAAGAGAEEAEPSPEPGGDGDRFSGSSRPIFIPTSTNPNEDGERGNRTALLLGLLLLGAAAGLWVGTSVLMKQEEPEFEVEEPAPSVEKTKKEEPPSVKFVPPPVPGNGDEVSSLRPGLPIRPKPSKDIPGEPEVPDTVAPVIPEPSPVSVPQAATAPRSTGKHTVEQEPADPAPMAKEPGQAPAKSGLEDPLAEGKRSLESARQTADRIKQEEGDAAMAKKEREIIEKATAEAEARAREMLQKASNMPLPSATVQGKGGKSAQAPSATERDRAAGGGQSTESDAREAQRLLAIARGETPPPAAGTGNSGAPGESGADKDSAKGLENTLGMRFVPVGSVQFSIYETRVRDYSVFIRETGHAKARWRNPGFDQTPDHPVVMVSWTDAMSFCKWLTDREHLSGDLPAEEYYRLPTDAEWSFAAGLSNEKGQTPELRDLGVQDRFPWGTTWPPPKGAGNYTGKETGSDVAIAGYDDGFPYTAPAGSYAPNEKGLHDMGGNVWEWCLDTWNLKTRSRVLRGASWFQGSLHLSLLSSCRVHSMPDRESDSYGFRVVRTSAPAKMR